MLGWENLPLSSDPAQGLVIETRLRPITGDGLSGDGDRCWRAAAAFGSLMDQACGFLCSVDAPGEAGDQLRTGNEVAGIEGFFDGGLVGLADGGDAQPAGIEVLFVALSQNDSGRRTDPLPCAGSEVLQQKCIRPCKLPASRLACMKSCSSKAGRQGHLRQPSRSYPGQRTV